jgi:hypothetical protein
MFARRTARSVCAAGALLAISLVLLIVGAGGASAATPTSSTSSPAAYPPPLACTVSVGVATLTAGQPTTITGSGFAPNETVNLSIHTQSTSLGTVTTDANGSFSKSVVIPSTLGGTHTIVATAPSEKCTVGVKVGRGTGGTDSNTAHHTTTGGGGTDSFSGGSPTTSTTAFTGFAAISATVIAGALLVGGVLFLLLGRRRRA